MPKKVAIAGLGPMGRRHVLALRQLDNVELVAVADVRPEALAAVECNGARRFTDAVEMFRAICPEVVIVATQGPSHHDLVLEAIGTGTGAVLCEKPISCSVAEADEMVRAAARHGCRLAVNHCRRHVPAYSWISEQLRSGKWGTFRSMRSSWPGIGLGCLGTHAVDLWRFFSGDEIAQVTAWVDPVRGSNPRGQQFQDPGGTLVGIGRSGARFVHEQLEDAAGPGLMVVDTTQVQLLIDEYAGTASITERDLGVKPGPGRPPKYEPVELPAGVDLTLDIVFLTGEVLRELICETGPITCDATHGLRSLEVIVAGHLSQAANHAPISLPLNNDDTKKWLPIT